MRERPAALITTSSESVFIVAQRLRDGDDDGERHHDRNDRRQDQRGDLEEGQRRLAAVRDEVDSGQHLRRPDDRQRPDQRGQEQHQARDAKCSVR